MVDLIASSAANSIPFYASNGSALSATTTFTILPSGRIGIGTTTPGSLFSIQGVANFTAGTSTFQSSGGINLSSGGCYAINGTCIGAATSGVTSIAQLFGTAQTGVITFATSTDTNLGMNVTNTNGAFTFAPTWSGTLSIGRGGTGVSSFTANQMLYTNASGALVSVATSSLNIGGSSANVTGLVALANGGTGWANVQAGGILYGNGAGALATTTQGTGGNLLAWLNGIPSWTSTTTMSIGGNAANVTGLVGIGNGGTGVSSFTANQMLYTSSTGALISTATSTLNIGGTSSNVTGLVAIANGGTGASGFTSGQLDFFNGSALVSASTTKVNNAGFYLGIGTTSPQWLVQLASSTAPQLALSDGSATSNHWVFRSTGGSLFLATSSPSTFATSTVSAFSISANGIVALASALPVTSGGTGVTSFASNQMLYTSSTGALISTATSTLNIGGTSANVTGLVALANGGTGWANVQAGGILYGNGAGALATTTQGTGGNLLAWLNGIPSWTSTTTMSIGGNAANVTGLVAIANGGTGASGFTSGQLDFFNGSAIVSASTTAVNNAGFFLGIGTTTPRWLLQLASSTAPQLALSDGSLTSNNWVFRSAGGVLYVATTSPTTFATSTATALAITANGLLGIGTSSPATKLEIGGATNNVTFDGYLNCAGFTTNANGLIACTASDQRLKNDVQPLDASSTLAALDSLNPVSFFWKAEADRGPAQQYGFIAQEVARIFPNLVSTSSPTALTPDGTLTVNYDGFIAPLILAVQHFSQAITTNVLTAVTGNFTHVKTQELCVGSTCVTESQLQELLRQSGQQGSPAQVSVPATTPVSDASSTPAVNAPTAPGMPVTDASVPVAPAADASGILLSQ